MTISSEEFFKTLPKASQKKVLEKSQEEIKVYRALQGLRKSLGLTQQAVAGRMKLNQSNISQLESQSDMRLSTLREYVEALGCELEINIRMPKGETAQVDLK